MDTRRIEPAADIAIGHDAADRPAAVLRPALVLFTLLALVTGLLYPLAVTALAQLAMPAAASGSLVERDGVVVGSRLIGQAFTDAKYVWGRPSATAVMPYNAQASGGSNLGPTSPALLQAVRERADALRASDPLKRTEVPIELVTASASGLDPHIGPAAAAWQVPRVALARGLPPARVQALVDAHTHRPLLPFLGEPVVDVLMLNLALDAAVR